MLEVDVAGVVKHLPAAAAPSASTVASVASKSAIRTPE